MWVSFSHLFLENLITSLSFSCPKVALFWQVLKIRSNSSERKSEIHHETIRPGWLEELQRESIQFSNTPYTPNQELENAKGMWLVLVVLKIQNFQHKKALSKLILWFIEYPSSKKKRGIEYLRDEFQKAEGKKLQMTFFVALKRADLQGDLLKVSYTSISKLNNLLTLLELTKLIITESINYE